MLNVETILQTLKDKYAEACIGKDWEYRAPEARPIVSRQVKALAEILVEAINKELTK